MSPMIQEEENDLQTGTSSVTDNLLSGRRRHSEEGPNNNNLARRGVIPLDGGNRRNLIEVGRRASSYSQSSPWTSNIRRESGTVFHPLSNLIPIPASDLITTSALPRDDSSSNTTQLGLLNWICLQAKFFVLKIPLASLFYWILIRLCLIASSNHNKDACIHTKYLFFLTFYSSLHRY